MMEVWIPLLSACLGGLIATIPLLLGLAVQIYIHVSENRRKDREAKTQLALELMRNNIDILEKDIDTGLDLVEIIGRMRLKKEVTNMSQEELRKEVQFLSFDENSKYNQARAETIAEKVAYSLGNKFYAQYKKLDADTTEFLQYFVFSATYSEEEADKLELKVIASAAKLHGMLEEKLISIRE